MPELHKKQVLKIYRKHCKKIKGLKRKKYILKYILASKVIHKQAKKYLKKLKLKKLQIEREKKEKKQRRM